MDDVREVYITLVEKVIFAFAKDILYNKCVEIFWQWKINCDI